MTKGSLPLREQLKAGLKTAMKIHQTEVVSVLRSTLSAIDNAEAVPLTADMLPTVGKLNEVARKELTEEQIYAIVQTEVDGLKTSIEEYQKLGKVEEVNQLQIQWEALKKYI